MTTLEFEVSGIAFRASRMNARQQFNVLRRISPLLDGLAASLPKGMNAIGEMAMLDALRPALQALATLPDADCEYVFAACLSTVMREHTGGWAKIVAADGTTFLFDDLNTLPMMLQITIKVLESFIAPLFSGAPQISEISAAARPAKVTTGSRTRKH